MTGRRPSPAAGRTTRIWAAALAVMPALALSACADPQEGGGGGAAAEDAAASTEAPPPASEPDGMILEVTVGPEREDCVGVAPMRCLVVDGELFYESIEGFEHEKGYEYRLQIERYDAWPGQAEPPQDASRYGYRLIEVISKARP